MTQNNWEGNISLRSNPSIPFMIKIPYSHLCPTPVTVPDTYKVLNYIFLN